MLLLLLEVTLLRISLDLRRRRSWSSGRVDLNPGLLFLLGLPHQVLLLQALLLLLLEPQLLLLYLELLLQLQLLQLLRLGGVLHCSRLELLLLVLVGAARVLLLQLLLFDVPPKRKKRKVKPKCVCLFCVDSHPSPVSDHEEEDDAHPKDAAPKANHASENSLKTKFKSIFPNQKLREHKNLNVSVEEEGHKRREGGV